MSLITLVNQSWPNWANQWQTDRTTLVTAPPWPPPPPPCRPPPPETPRRPPNQVFTSVGPADFFPRQRLLFFKGQESAQRLLRSLSVLVKMAANPECLHVILPLLSEHVGVFVRALQDTNHSQCHSMMATFLHNLLKV